MSLNSLPKKQLTMEQIYLKKILNTAFIRSLSVALPMHHVGNATIITCGSSSWNTASHNAPPKGKVLVFGKLSSAMLSDLGLQQDTNLAPIDGMDTCPPANGSTPFTQSPAFLQYGEHPLLQNVSQTIRRRPFTRFDYTDEWNNLGFGRIRTDDSPWAACGGFVAKEATELCGMFTSNETSQHYAGSYLTLYDTPSASILWCARPVGPVDSTEWSIIENFISDWRAEDMPCLPVLCQTPKNCQCLVTMRLDCDEAVASARPLFELYQSENIPFSLAVKTSLELTEKDIALLQEVKASGGSILSHTHTHQYNWGNSFEEALQDAQSSRTCLQALFPQTSSTNYAVSPFHTNPPYAIHALEEAGYEGFISGIIHNDPEYLLGRAGIAPFAQKGIVSISQQSMLHGDCYKFQDESINTHIKAFEAQYAARGIFGYLDHPFSSRYQYDWDSEEQRIDAHKKLITALKKYDNVLFWSEEQCFDFVKALAQVRLHVQEDGSVITINPYNTENLQYRYKNHIYSFGN